MYDNPLLAALFEESLSNSSSRLDQARALFNNSGGLAIILPQTSVALEIDPQVLYKDNYLLSHVVKLNQQDLKKGIEATTLANTTVHLSESHVTPRKGFNTQAPIKIQYAYPWNPGVSYISPERTIIVVQIEELLISPAKKKEATPEPKDEKRDLEQLLGRKKGQRAKTSAVLRPLLLSFNSKQFSDGAEMGAAFRSTVNEAFNQVKGILDVGGDDLWDALQDYFEYQNNLPVLEQLNKINHDKYGDLTLAKIQPHLKWLDLCQLDLPVGAHKYHKVVDEVAKRFGVLNLFHTVADTCKLMLQCIETLATQEITADELLGLLIAVSVRSSYRFLDIVPDFMRHFCKDSVNPDSGKLGYAILSFESAFIFIRENFEQLKELSDKTQEFWEHPERMIEVGTAVPAVLPSGPGGSDVLFHLVRTKQNDVFRMMLRTFPTVFTPEFIRKDRDEARATLLFAAVENYNRELTDTILEIIVSNFDVDKQREYLAQTDETERSIAHLLHYNDTLIAKVGHLVNWTHRNMQGLTPLLILCSCYDHNDYDAMLSLAISKWCQQKDGSLYDHIDNKENSLLHLINPSDRLIIDKLSKVVGFDANFPNCKGRTPIMLAAKYDRKYYVEQLLELGADYLQLDNGGMTVFDHAKGESFLAVYKFAKARSYNNVDVRALRATQLNSSCIISIYQDDGRVVYRTHDEFLALCSLLEVNYPNSWVPPLRMESELCIDPWKAFKSILQKNAANADYFLMLLQSHATFKNCEEVLQFCYADGDFEPERQSFGDDKWQKCQRVDGSTKISYSQQETQSIATFFEYSIDQLRTYRLLFTRLSNCITKVQNCSYSYRSMLNYLSCRIANGCDGREAVARMQRRFSMGIGCPNICEDPAQTSLVSQTRATASLIEALERPVQMIKGLDQAKQDLENHRMQLSALGESKSWPIPFFEEKRTKAIQDEEAALLDTRKKIRNLTQNISRSHYSLASELASYNQFRDKVIMDVMHSLTRKNLTRSRHMLTSLQCGLQELSQSGYLSPPRDSSLPA